MSFLAKIFGSKKVTKIEWDTATWLLVPSVVRIGIGGKDATLETETLRTVIPTAAGNLANGDLAEKISTITKGIPLYGLGEIVAQAKNNLTPIQRSKAIELGLAAIFASPIADEKDFGILSSMGGSFDITDPEFDELFTNAKPSVDWKFPTQKM